MGAKIDMTSHITISEKTSLNGFLKFYGWQDIDGEFINRIAENSIIKFVQIASPLPRQAFDVIYRMLSVRQDMYLRIYGLYGEETIDLSLLQNMKNLKHLVLDFSVKNRQDKFDFSVLTRLENLQSLRLNLFDLKDYSFVNNLSHNLEELHISADTMGGSIVFDCKWLMQYRQLKNLYLGKKAKKNIESIAQLEKLENLTLRGIKLNSFDFLKDKKLQSLAVHWCSMNDLSSLADFTSLKNLELWRISKLEDISFISTLENLETLSLTDLKYIHTLPDLSALKNLKDIKIDNVPVDISTLPEDIQKIIHR